MSERAINILCFYERRGSDGKLKIEYEEHVVRASMAEERYCGSSCGSCGKR